MGKVILLAIGLGLFYVTFKKVEFSYWKPAIVFLHMLYFISLIQDQFITCVMVLEGYLYFVKRHGDWMLEEKIRKENEDLINDKLKEYLEGSIGHEKN